MAYMQIGDEWVYQDDEIDRTGEVTGAPDTGAPNYPSDGGDSNAFGGAPTGADRAGDYDPGMLVDLMFSTGGVDLNSALGLKVTEYLDGRGLANKGNNDDGNSFFGKLKAGLNSAYEKDPLKFLQFGLQGLAGVYTASQAREIAKTKAQGDANVVNQKHANDKEMQDRYTSSLRGTGVGRTKQAQKKLARIGGAQVFDASGNYNRS